MHWRMPALSGLLFSVTLGGFAPAPSFRKLPYATIDIDKFYGERLTFAGTVAGSGVSPGTGSPTFPPTLRPPAQVVRPDRAAWHLTLDGGVTADSNVTNRSDDRFLDLRQNGRTISVELDPALRARSGVGRGASVSAGAKLRLSDGAAIAVDADGQALDHKGGRNDDISFLLAAGPVLTWSEGQSASVQIVAGQSWYGGTSTNRGVGLRTRYSVQVKEGTSINLLAEGRSFDSGYGRAFGGEQAGAYLSASMVLDPVTSASFGLFARRDWLHAREYANYELGIYGGVSRYLGPLFTGSLSAGLSRTVWDAPLLYLSEKQRNEWRANAGVSLTTREPIGLGIYPSVGYSYNRTNGSIDFFDADRHRVRLGVRRAY